MPYPCCCEPAQPLVDCSVCSGADDLIPPRLQVNMPQIRVQRRTGFNPYATVYTEPAGTKIFTNVGLLQGAPSPYVSCCFAMPPRRLCDGPTIGGNRQSLDFAPVVYLVLSGVNNRYVVVLREMLFRRFTVLNNVVQPESFNCKDVLTNHFQSIASCNQLQTGVSVTLDAFVPTSVFPVRITCQGTEWQYNLEHSAANVTVQVLQ